MTSRDRCAAEVQDRHYRGVRLLRCKRSAVEGGLCRQHAERERREREATEDFLRAVEAGKRQQAEEGGASSKLSPEEAIEALMDLGRWPHGETEAVAELFRVIRAALLTDSDASRRAPR